METLLILTIFVSFFITFLIVPFWIRKAKEEGYIGKDMHVVWIRHGKIVAYDYERPPNEFVVKQRLKQEDLDS